MLDRNTIAGVDPRALPLPIVGISAARAAGLWCHSEGAHDGPSCAMTLRRALARRRNQILFDEQGIVVAVMESDEDIATDFPEVVTMEVLVAVSGLPLASDDESGKVRIVGDVYKQIDGSWRFVDRVDSCASRLLTGEESMATVPDANGALVDVYAYREQVRAHVDSLETADAAE